MSERPEANIKVELKRSAEGTACFCIDDQGHNVDESGILGVEPLNDAASEMLKPKVDEELDAEAEELRMSYRSRGTPSPWYEIDEDVRDNWRRVARHARKFTAKELRNVITIPAREKRIAELEGGAK